MYVVGQIFFFCFFLSCMLCLAAKNVFGNPSSSSPEPEKGKHTRTFLANAAKEGGRDRKWGRGLFFHNFPLFSRFVTSFSLKREEEETKEHLVRKSGKASVVEEEKKEKCAYG